MKGVSLVSGTTVVLALDGTLVYVEDVQPTYAGVVALPEQPSARSDERVFTAGSVRMKKISPFSQADRDIAHADLSARNVAFIQNFKTLREQNPNHVDRTPDEQAIADARDAGPARKVRTPRGERKPKSRLLRCKQCNEQSGHPNHPGDHEFVSPSADDVATAVLTGQARKPRTPRAAKPDAGPATYTLQPNYSLDTARSQPRGDKYNEGNRSFRVVKALESLPSCTGTLDDVVAAIGRDGGRAMKNAPKVARRTLNQCATPAFGNVVTRAGESAEPTDSGDDDAGEN